MNFSHGAARRPALSAPILAIVVVQAASCGPIAQDNPAVGDLAFLDDQGYTQWSRAKIPRWTTVTFDAQHDALQLNGWTTTLRVQAGALASSPYPRWELTHHRSSLEGKSAELANIFSGGTEATGAWQFGTAKDAYSNMTAHQDALSKNDAFQMEAIVYDYAPYTPIVHAFPVRAADVPREGLRVYDHGACSGFVLWDEIFADLPYAVTKSIAEMAFCVEVFGGKAIDTMIRHALGFFPTFTRTPSTPYAIGGPGDGFAIFSGIELGTAAGPNFHAANYTRYEILAQNGKVAINRVFGAWRGNATLGSAIDQGYSSALPAQIGEAINSSPKFVVRLPVAGLGAECSSGSTCDLAYLPCAPGKASDLQNCAERVALTIELGLKTYNDGLVSNLNTKDYTEDVLASDFTCDAEATSPKGGACTYHIPIGRVNVFTDGVELVVREPQVPGKHGTIDAYATLESWRNRMNDKKCSTGAGPCPPAHTTTAISQCNGRSFPTLRTYRSLATPPAFLDNACPWDLP